MQHYTFGLGYKPTKEDHAQKAKEAREKALAKKEGRPIPMKKVRIPPTMNGYWIREGDDLPFCGFSEPFTDPASGKRTPSLEIFFEMEPHFDVDDISGKQLASKEQEKDWVDGTDSLALEILFDHVDQVDWCDADAVMMIGTVDAKNCCGLIIDTGEKLKNW